MNKARYNFDKEVNWHEFEEARYGFHSAKYVLEQKWNKFDTESEHQYRKGYFDAVYRVLEYLKEEGGTVEQLENYFDIMLVDWYEDEPCDRIIEPPNMDPDSYQE